MTISGNFTIKDFGRRAGFFTLICFLILLPLVGLATAQGTAPASIIGQVTDESGAVLPGVTVTATSSALQVPQVSAVTDEQGAYRLTPLPIGTYAVEYTLSGFQSIRQSGVLLTPGFTAKLDQAMKIGTVAETITVSGAAPVVDVTATAVRTDLTREAVDLIPSARSGITSFLNQVPSVRSNFAVGGSQFSSGVQFRAFGQSGAVWMMLDGIVVTDVNSGTQGMHIEFNSVDGLRVQPVGNTAEMPKSGIMMDVAIKSGGNQFHGLGSYDGTSGRFQSDNINAALTAAGVTGTTNLHVNDDVAGAAGGKIVESKLWYYAAGRFRRQKQDILGAFYPDGTPAINAIWQRFGVGKLSYQITPQTKLTGFYHESDKQEIRGASALISTESMERVPAQYITTGVEWQATRGDSLTLSVVAGDWIEHAENYAYSPTPKVPRMDVVTLRVSGDALTDGQVNDEYRKQLKATASVFKPNFFHGSHQFKGGIEVNGTSAAISRNDTRTGNYQELLSNGAPFELVTFAYPSTPQNLGFWIGTYAQDTWTIARRLTLDVGLRYDHDNAYVPAQCSVGTAFAQAACYPKIQLNVWDSVGPQLHAAYDVSGHGTTVVKGGYGRFWHKHDLSPDVTTFNPLVSRTTTYRWHDVNGDGAYQPGEVDLDPNGPDIVSVAAGVVGVADPKQKQPYADEFTLAIERQLVPNFAVRVTGVYSRNKGTFRIANPLRPYSVYNIPITSPDPGPDGTVGTADDPGTFLTYYDYPASYRGAAFDQVTVVTDPNADQTYKSIELAATKRLSSGWQFSTSYSATKKHIPFGTGTQALNPNTEINTANDTWEWGTKVSGSYRFPKDITASANFENRSGTEQARQVLLRGGQQVASLTVNAEPLGSIRLPSTNVLDLQVKKSFSLGGERSVEIRAVVSNVMNVNTVTARTLRSGASYLVPTAVVPPRIAQFGVQYTF